VTKEGNAMLQIPEQIVPGSMWRHHSGAGEKCEGEAAAVRSCYRLAPSPIPHLPVPLVEGR